MNTIATLSLLLLFLFLSLPTLSLSKTPKCHSEDKTVLLQIKKALGNPYLTISWNNNLDCCEWNSLKCDEVTGRVTRLFIDYDNNLTSHIPDLVGNLPYLDTLHFRKLPNLTGGIPFALTKLTRLKDLEISWTKVSGPIPSFLAQIKTLTYLDLSFNQLTGSIPSSLSSLPNLEYLNLGRNRLTGPIPESFGNFPPSLQYLHLSHNQLTGTVPRSLGYINFTQIDFSRNQLEGDVAFLFGKNKTYFHVDLSRNKFAFDGSKVEVNSEELRYLDVNHNRITGNLPASLVNQYLQFLNVSYNRMCGEIPKGDSLQRFDYSSYFHNKCLCGSPLPACK